MRLRTFVLLKEYCAMGFAVDYHEGLDIISGKVEGELTRELAANYFAEVGALAAKNGCGKVLTDLREAKLMATELDMESLSSELNSKGVSTAFKRAMVVSEDVKGYKTWENHCFRNGYQRLKLFFDQQKAEDWLSEN